MQVHDTTWPIYNAKRFAYTLVIAAEVTILNCISYIVPEVVFDLSGCRVMYHSGHSDYKRSSRYVRKKFELKICLVLLLCIPITRD